MLLCQGTSFYECFDKNKKMAEPSDTGSQATDKKPLGDRKRSTVNVINRWEDATDPKKKKEEDKQIRLVHKDTRRKVETLFDAKQTNGHVTYDQFFAMLATIQEVQDYEGINYNSGLLTKFMDEEMAYETLTRRGCLVVIGMFISGARKHTERIRKEETKTESQKVHYVSTGDYLKLMCTCRLKADKKNEIRWQGLGSMNPKTSLILIIVLLSLLMSLIISTVLCLLVFDLVIKENDLSLKMDGTMLGDAGKRLVPTIQNQMLEYFHGTAKELRVPIENALRGTQNGKIRLMEHSNEQLMVIASNEQERLKLKAYETLDSKLRAFRIHSEYLGASVAQLHKVASKLQNEGFYTIIVSTETHTLRFKPSACSVGDSCESLRCVKSVVSQNEEIHHEMDTFPFPKVQSLVGSTVLKKAKAAICMYYPLNRSSSELFSSLEKVLNTSVGNDEVFEYHFYYRESYISPLRPFGESMPFGSLPLFVQMWILMTKTSDSHQFITDNYDAYGAIAALRFISFQSLLYVVRLENRQQAVDRIEFGILNHTNCDNCEISPVVARWNGSFPSPLGFNSVLDPSVASHLVLGLNNESGAMLSKDKSLQDIIVGFTSIDYTNASDGLVYSFNFQAREVVQLASTFFTQIVSQANTQSFKYRRFILAERDSWGNVRYLVSPSMEIESEATIFARKCFRSRFNDVEGKIGEFDAFCVRLTSPAVVLIATLDHNEMYTKFWLAALWGVLVGIGFTFLILVFIFFLIRSVLNRIEEDYRQYKNQIEDEKQKFSELVKDVMPPYIDRRMRAGEKLILDSHSSLTFVVSDMMRFMESAGKLSTVEIVRLVAYVFLLEDVVAEHYNIHKVKMIGDAYFGVAGLEDFENTDNSDHGKNTEEEEQEEEEKKELKTTVIQDDPVYRSVSFAAVLQLLMSPLYTHVPERTECIAAHSGGVELGAFSTHGVKIGVHTGSANVGVIDPGRSPLFDCYGPSVILAMGLESTAPANRVQLSSQTHDLLEKLDTQKAFEFDSPRKTLVKGYGTVRTFVLKGTLLSVPENILKAIHIDRTVKKQSFTPEGLVLGEDLATQEDEASAYSAKQRSESNDDEHPVKEGTDAEDDNLVEVPFQIPSTEVTLPPLPQLFSIPAPGM